MKSVFITSPGRCGMHWLGWMLRDLLGLEKITIKPSMSCGRVTAWYRMVHGAGHTNRSRGGENLIFMQHPPLEYLLATREDWLTIVLVRDLRDCAISAAHYAFYRQDTARRIKRNWSLPILPRGGTLDEYIDHFKVYGVNVRWWESYLVFCRSVPHIHLKYEHVMDRPAEQLSLVTGELERWGIPISRLEEVIRGRAFISFTKGRERGTEDKSHHYRKGIVGDWRNYFTEAENEAFCTKFGKYMEAFGYGD